MKLVKKLILAGLTLSNVSFAQQLAFPGAEGFGRFATGGRGGEVYHVTNLNDKGAGSLRDGLSKSNRIIVFDVGGVINITDRLVIPKNTYVAGQTAPGGGITIYGNGVALNNTSGNSIIRYIRIRMGENGDYRKDALGISDGQNYIFDNVSISWGWDGTVDVNGSNIDNLTFQDCIIGQGLDIVGHSTGGLMQSGKWSSIRNIYIDNETRNPKGKGTQEVINCVMYNWGSNGYIMGSTDGLSEANVVGNNFVYGPSSSSNSHITGTTASFNVYGSDNWIDNNKNGKFDPTLMTDYKSATKVAKPFDYNGMKKVMPAAQAFEYVLTNAGASKPHDEVDKYLINEIRSYGTKGAIIKRESDNGITGNVGTVASGTAPKDTDKDGMPDAWETMRGLNPNVADDKGDDDKDGYTNIEEYLSCLVGEGDGCVSTTPCTTPAKPSVSNVSYCQGVVASALTATASTGNELVWYGTSATGGTASDVAPVPSTATAGSFTYYVSQKTTAVNCESARSAIVVTVKSCDCQGVENGKAIKDICDRCVGGTTGKTACVESSEIETDACSYDGVLETKNAGFKGTAYININNAIGSQLSFNVNGTSSDTYTLSFRYASGGTADRNAKVLVNGVSQNAAFAFPATGVFTTYSTIDISLALNAGSNTVQLVANTADGLPNIDQIGYVSAGVSKGNCVVTGIDVNLEVNDLHLYPNPTQGKVSLATESSWILKDALGHELSKGAGKEIDLFNFSKGIYLLTINNRTIKLIKE